MSRVPCQNRSMRMKKSHRFRLAPDEIVGHFGKVKLVQRHDGRHILRGGTREQRQGVRQWCAQYAPFLEFVRPIEVVVVVA